MKERTVSIKGLIKWLWHNRIVILCVTLSAAVFSVCFFSAEYMRKKDKSEQSVTVTGKIAVTADADAESMSVFNSYSAAAFNFLSDSAVQKEAALAADAGGIGYDDAMTVYRSCTFVHPYYGIIVYTYTTCADNADTAQSALGYLVKTADDSLSGFSQNFGLKVIDSLTEKNAVTNATSVPAYLSMRVKKLALFTIGAFAAVCAVFAFIYLLMTRVRDANDIEARYDLPVLSTVTRNKKDRRGDYNALYMKLAHAKSGHVVYVAGRSKTLPERLYAACEGKNCVVLVYDRDAQDAVDKISQSGCYRVAQDFDAESSADSFDMVIAYVRISDDRSYALGIIRSDCYLVATQYRTEFTAAEDFIRDMKSIDVAVKGFILEEN